MLKPKDPAAETSEQSVQQQLDDLNKERMEWEAKRQEQVADLREQSRLLSEAWQRLENQQRSVMQTRRTNVQEPPESTGEPSSSAVLSSTLCAANPKASSPSAIEQFRLLQRDVQAHQLPNADLNRTSGESS